MKLPNSYGTVSIIDKSSKRRKPYRVQVNVDWKINIEKGTCTPVRKTIGYASTRKEGYQMLAEYHDKPFNLDLNNVSFEYLYDKWYDYKKGTNIQENSLKLYDSFRKHYDFIAKKPFNDITRNDLQEMVDGMDTSLDHQRKVLSIYKQVREYAIGNNVKVGADISMFVNKTKKVSSSKHSSFTDEEIELLWNNRNDVIDLVLINIYTGLRPIEFFNISEVNEDYFITGSKTDSGRNRIVPLNDKIKDMFHYSYENNLIKMHSNSDGYYQKVKKEFKKLGLGTHSPYDCRHTFATLMSRYGADEHCTKLIMGHKIQDLTKRVYTHKMVEDLIREVNKI